MFFTKNIVFLIYYAHWLTCHIKIYFYSAIHVVQSPTFLFFSLSQPWDTSHNALILEMNISKPSNLREVLLPFPSGAILNSSRARPSCLTLNFTTQSLALQRQQKPLCMNFLYFSLPSLTLNLICIYTPSSSMSQRKRIQSPVPKTNLYPIFHSFLSIPSHYFTS